VSRRALLRTLATGAALCALLSACGHYGPPVRPKPQPQVSRSEPEASEDREAGPEREDVPAEEERERHGQ
jgi:hypothetical protein